MNFSGCFAYAYPTRCRILAATVAFALVLCSAADARAQAKEMQGKLKRDVLVGPKRDVQLKADQVVQVVTSSGSVALIVVKNPDGTKAAYQVEASALEILAPEAAKPAAAAPAAQPAPQPVAPTPPSPAPAAATPAPAPASTSAASAPPPSPASAAGDSSVPEDKPTVVHVNWPSDTKLPAPYGSFAEAKAGSYSYKLYLPPGYYSNPGFTYPALFVMAPGGSAGMGDIKDRAKLEGWIVVMFVEAKNGPWGPIFGNQLAACADIEAKGIRIQKGLKFATGFSGGARGTSMLTQISPGFSGQLLQGAGFAFGEKGEYNVKGIPKDRPYAVFMCMGEKDGNKKEVDKMKDELRGVPIKFMMFDGGHQPAPLPPKNLGLDWLMTQAFTGKEVPEDLRACGARHFAFLAKRWENQPNAALKAEYAPSLVVFGEKLNLPAGSPEAAMLKAMKEAAPSR